MKQRKFSVDAARQVKRYAVYLFFLLSFFVSLLFLSHPALTQVPPYPPSPVIESVTWDFAKLVRLGAGSDLWPITWAADGHLYNSWGDGTGFGDAGNDFGGPIRLSMGFSRIEGTPDDLREHPSSNPNVFNVYGGQNAENPNTVWDCENCGKSAGMVSVDGTLYAWINTQNGNPADLKLAWSNDLAAHWQLARWVFPRTGDFFPSAFLNFGKDNAGARDNYVYSYGAKWIWTQGPENNVYLCRVLNSRIRERAAYEFFAGLDNETQPVWTAV